MSVLTVTVAGVDRTEFWHEPTSTNWEDPLNGRGTGSITFVVPLSAGVRFSDGQEIVILEDGTPRFGGQLMEPEETERGDNDQNAVLFFNCQIADNNILADQRIVSEEWVDTEFSLIVSGVVTNWMYDEGISLAGVQTGAAFSIEAGNVLARDVFDTLADKSKRGWRFDESKVLHFKDRDQDAAPFGMNGSTMLRGSVTVRPDRQTYRNWQLVEAGTDEFPILVVSGNADEIAARAALTGTSGRVEHLAQNLEITNSTIAREWTGELLDKYDAIGAVVVGKTRLPGFHAGQAVVVDFPNHDIDEVDMLIDSVTAEVVAVGNEQEIWYTIRAITGDPYGGYQQHYRKVAPIKGPLRFRNEPGLFRVDPTPGVVVHDPEPGDRVWFQGAQSGTLDSSAGVIGITNQEAGGGGFIVTVRRGPIAVPRKTILEGWTIDANENVSTSPGVSSSYDELVASSFKEGMVVSPDSQFVCYIERDPGNDPIFIISSISGGGLLGSVVLPGFIDNNTGFEGAWVGDYIYIPESTTGGSIFVVDVSNPGSPQFETEFVTTATGAITSCVASADGNALYCVEEGGGKTFIALDISDPTAITEADTQVYTNSTYHSLDIDLNTSHAEPQLAAVNRADANDMRVAQLAVTGTTFGTFSETLVPLSVAQMDGYTAVYDADVLAVTSHIKAASPAGSLRTHVFNLDPVAGPTLVESLSYNAGTVGNLNQSRSTLGKRLGFWFGFNTDAEVTFSEQQFNESVPLTIDNPLRAGFGGTGLGEAARGDIMYADRDLSDDIRGHGEWSRLEIGAFGQVLMVSGSESVPLPAWQDAASGLPEPIGDAGSIIMASGVPPVGVWVPQSAIDHGALGGLANDDHIQYALVTGTRAFTGTITAPGAILTGGLSVRNANVAVHRLGTSSLNTYKTYSSNAAARTILALTKSSSDSEVNQETADNESLGLLTFDGIDTNLGARTACFFKGEQDGVSGATKVPGRFLIGTSDGTASAAERVRISSTGQVYINEVANSFMALGLTINQGDADDQAFAIMSSDIAHGMTTLATTATFFALKKWSATFGGVWIQGLTESAVAYGMTAEYTSPNTTKGPGGSAPFEFWAREKSGTGVGAQTANANIALFRSNATVVWNVDAEGDTWQSGTLFLAGASISIESFSEASSNFAIWHCYSTTPTHRARFTLHKSASGTEADVATADGDVLGSFDFAGTDTGPGSQLAADITVVQDGAATATRVPAYIKFSTSNGSTISTERLRITKDGHIAIAADKKFFWDGLDGSGDTFTHQPAANWHETQVGGDLYIIASSPNLIGDDAAVRFAAADIPDHGFCEIVGNDVNQSVIFFYNLGASTVAAGLQGATISLDGNAARTGTDGTDGTINVGASSAGLDIENRAGGAINFSVVIRARG